MRDIGGNGVEFEGGKDRWKEEEERRN